MSDVELTKEDNFLLNMSDTELIGLARIEADRARGGYGFANQDWVKNLIDLVARRERKRQEQKRCVWEKVRSERSDDGFETHLYRPTCKGGDPSPQEIPETWFCYCGSRIELKEK